MRWKFVLNVVGVLLLFTGLAMIVPILVGLYYADGSAPAFLKSIGITFFAGLALYLPFRKAKVETISQREGLAVVAVGWAMVGLFGAFPFCFQTGPLQFAAAG